MTLYQPAGDDSDHTQVPVGVVQNNGVSFAAGQESICLSECLLLGFPVEHAPLFIQAFKLPGPGGCLYLVIGQQEIHGASGVSETAGRVDPRPNGESDGPSSSLAQFCSGLIC